MSAPLLAWHFVEMRKGQPRLHCPMGMDPDDPALIAEAGYTYSTDDHAIIPCKAGMHASVRAIDALQFAPGPIVCRVRLHGEIKAHGEPIDKHAARNRDILWMADATMALHEFACLCAEDALRLIEKPDPRSVRVIEIKRAWMRGEATDAELAAARAAAWAAARAAASEAARAAAWAAAWAAASEAAWAATRAAASEAARAAAWAAARAAQNERLESMLAGLERP